MCWVVPPGVIESMADDVKSIMEQEKAERLVCVCAGSICICVYVETYPPLSVLCVCVCVCMWGPAAERVPTVEREAVRCACCLCVIRPFR